MEFKNKERKKSVTASLIKRLHSRITGSGADFLLSSSHDFLQFRAAADVLKHKHDRTTVTGLGGLQGTRSDKLRVRVLCAFLLISLGGRGTRLPFI